MTGSVTGKVVTLVCSRGGATTRIPWIGVVRQGVCTQIKVMIFIDISLLATLYLTTGLFLIFGLWLYYDRRDRRQYENLRNPTVFVCVRCNRIYSFKDGTRTAACPDCRHVNIPLRF